LKTVIGVKKYANKFLVNTKKTEIPKAIEQLEAVAKLIRDDREFRTFVISPIFDEKEMKKTLAFISKKVKAAAKTAKYLQYLHDEKALGSLPQIVEAINTIYLEMKKRSKATVASSCPISKKNEVELKRVLKRVTGRDVDMEFVTDPSLIGGMRIRIGSTMYDSSIKGQLGLLRDKFIEG
jgi:F-type H+-transporting ATPase subunit delta